jgi:protein involved in polysaccharide export with SLBB domain
MRLLFIFLSLVLNSHWALGQVSSAMEATARTQLQQKGISETEMRTKMLEKGINIDQISVDQLPALQPLVEQAIREIEAEKAKTAAVKSVVVPKEPQTVQSANIAKDPKVLETEVKKVAAKSSSEVNERIRNGATIEEAVTEALQDEAIDEKAPKAKIYGQELFRNKSLDTYRTTKDARPSDAYVLGVGDEVTVVIFGQSQGDFKYVLNEEGYINPPGVGRIFLKGVAYGKAHDLVRARFSRAFVFREDQFSLSLSTARTITINIFGETEQYGSFTVSAINTAFNVLAAAGGPTDIGSVRNIKITRNGKVKELDVYAFMNNPGLQYEYFLDNNDVIFVPVAEKVVNIQGAINRPFAYELKPGESLKDLVLFSGGFAPNAYRNRLQIRRNIVDRTVLIDVDFTKNQDFQLQNGDQVLVIALPVEVQNTVTVSGEVDFPGAYALDQTLDLSALIFKSQPKRTARQDIAFVMRKKVDGGTQMIQVNLEAAAQGIAMMVLEPNDQLLVFKQDRYKDIASVDIKGAVRDPAPRPHYKGLKLSEYLLLSGGLREDATDFGYILRTNPEDRTRSYLRINPRKAINEPQSSANIELLGLDEVKVLSKLEFRDSATIKVSGAVRKQIVLPFGQAITLSDAIKLAGGLKLEADKGKIDLFSIEIQDNASTRTSVKTIEVNDQIGGITEDIVLQPFDEIVVRSVPNFSLMQKVQLLGAVKYPGEYAITKPDEKLSYLIARAGGLASDAFPAGGKMIRTKDSVGVVVTRMDIAIKDTASAYNLILQDGDVVQIPKSLDLVTIRTLNTNIDEAQDIGAEQKIDKISVAYSHRRRARWYINQYAGGAETKANIQYLKVQHPNGHLKKTRNFYFFYLTPSVRKGSKILLSDAPKKPVVKERKPKKTIDRDKLLVQSLGILTTAATLILALR